MLPEYGGLPAPLEGDASSAITFLSPSTTGDHAKVSNHVLGPDFRVVTATGPDYAVAKVLSDKPAVVITDTTLDPRNGYDRCKQIKQIAPGTPVVILSSRSRTRTTRPWRRPAQADYHMTTVRHAADERQDQELLDGSRGLPRWPLPRACRQAAAAPAPAAAPVYAAPQARPWPPAARRPPPPPLARPRPSSRSTAPRELARAGTRRPPGGHRAPALGAAGKAGESLSSDAGNRRPAASRSPAVRAPAAAAAHVNGRWPASSRSSA